MKLEISKNILGKIEKTFRAIIFLIAFGLVLHAPLTVWASSVWPHYDIYFKSWKEALLVVAFVLGAVIVYAKKSVLPNKNIIKLIATYKVLHVLIAVLFFQGWLALVAGLMIDLRYVGYFVLVLFAAVEYEDFGKQFVRLLFWGACLVTVFSLLQVYVLPADFLSHIGYGKDTIMPYLTVDQNADFIRINSTLRGPNPLGAYMTVVISVLGVWIYRNYKKLDVKQSWVLSFAMVGALVGLWFSYSRSALLAIAIDLAIIGLFLFKSKINNRKLIIVTGLALAVFVGLFVAKDTYFVSNVLLHENRLDTNLVNSNDAHISSLSTGAELFFAHPLGVGVGSTGSASLYSASPYVIENQYLFVAHEVGWLGLGLFFMIQMYVFYLLWKKRRSWLAMSTLASGIGLAIIGIILPVWADETVAMLWWGLAAVAIGSKHYE